jgi:hypothetical protein
MMPAANKYEHYKPNPVDISHSYEIQLNCNHLWTSVKRDNDIEGEWGEQIKRGGKSEKQRGR